jgi:hypothetical protein
MGNSYGFTCDKKVRRNHPQRRYRVAFNFFLYKKGIQRVDDKVAAEMVAKKFSVNASTLLRDFAR